MLNYKIFFVVRGADIDAIIFGGYMTIFLTIIGVPIFIFTVISLCIGTANFILIFSDIFTGNNFFRYQYKNKMKELQYRNRYNIPAINYIFSFFTLTALMGIIGRLFDIDSVLIAYSISICVYPVILNIGMYRKTSKIEQGVYFRDLLKNHKKFLQLSFLPLAFLITIIGFLFASMDKIEGLTGWIMSIENLSKIIESIYGMRSADVDSHFFQHSLKLLLIIYIFSVPLQVVAYFCNQVSEYIFECGKGYKTYFIQIWNGFKCVFKQAWGKKNKQGDGAKNNGEF